MTIPPGMRPTPPLPLRVRLIHVLVVAALLAGCGGSAAGGASNDPGRTGVSSNTTATPLGTATPTPVPTPTPKMPGLRHVYLVIMENEDYSAVVGSGQAPYINGLIGRYALATNYSSVAHPSQPNYVALFSGSTQGVADDNVHDISGTNLVDQLESNGRTWRVYAQNYPGGCFTGDVAQNGPDGSGTYARKHNPAISFTDISGNPARCANIRPFSAFDPAAADFELIIPNLCNDMHDCGVPAGDRFLSSFVPKITDSPAFAGSVLFIVWDEGRDTGAPRGGRVPAIIVSPMVKPGSTSGRAFDHYALLRSIEDALGLGCLAATCQSGNMAELFTH